MGTRKRKGRKRRVSSRMIMKLMFIRMIMIMGITLCKTLVMARIQTERWEIRLRVWNGRRLRGGMWINMRLDRRYPINYENP